jgi:hypothetical protein
MPDFDDRLYTVREVADFFEVKQTTVRNWLNGRHGELMNGYWDFEKKRWYVSLSEIKRFAKIMYGDRT